MTDIKPAAVQRKITKAVIPAAGLGTRMLPIAHAVPKEMLPVVDRPAISYLVEEAAASGITDILIITGRGKDAMEDYFDYSPEYDARLTSTGKFALADELRAIYSGINLYFIRQHEALGLGHAVGRARSFAAGDPFIVLYGDDLIFSEVPVCRQLIDSYNRHGLPVAGVKNVPDELVMKYCSLKAEPLKNGNNNEYFVTDMIEKPRADQIYTNLSILGRVLLPPEIFDIIESTPPGAGGEIQLTDAMKTLAQKSGIAALDFDGERFDMGSKLGFMKANVTKAIGHPEIGEEFTEFLKGFVLGLGL